MTKYKADSARTQYVQGALANYGYREIGETTGTPIILLQRYRGTIDDWDPALIEELSKDRRVIVFDNVGIGSSDGVAPDTIAAMAEGVADFVSAQKYGKVDIVGWSMGGFVAQVLALDHADIVNKVVVAGSGPGEPSVRPTEDPKSVEIRQKVEPSVDDIIYIFFSHTETGKAAAGQVLSRFFHHDSGEVLTVKQASWEQQAKAIQGWNSGQNSAWARLSEIEVPVLVANGSHDIMEPSIQSFEMARKLKGAVTTFYSDSGHAFLFQYPEKFARKVTDFFAS
ncbi:alpha/beta fold hydrolase [Rhizobium sp. BE258]|uniref:alpha/beta fold hydrolase n=1 Tax=Rhizobium sp. BE258 TaxID=2817722 RepID=UPI0013AFD846|nr:alpha/beta hydrolase [Rhizobium sp. BE258]MDR7144973.1 pimeloyl-ACP methyl ester carboxylesterase [Rhizobium sp. BE258]